MMVGHDCHNWRVSLRRLSLSRVGMTAKLSVEKVLDACEQVQQARPFSRTDAKLGGPFAFLDSSLWQASRISMPVIPMRRILVA